MNDGLTLRVACPGDVDAIYRLICALEATELPRERFDAIFARQMADDGYRCIVAEREGGVIGLLNLRIEPQLHHSAPVAEILELVVDPKSRGLGVGKALMARAGEAAREAGCALIEVACNVAREDAHRFYRREGMEADHLRFMRRL